MSKRQRVDATISLIIADPLIARDAKILDNLINAARRGIGNPGLRQPRKHHPALYAKYRTREFPLRTRRNRILPAWRSLSPWMRLQLASLCLGELPHRQVRIRLHDEKRFELEHTGEDIKAYMRDRLTRILREKFAPPPAYLFVLEDLDTDGFNKVRPHAHGVVQLPTIDPSSFTDGRTALGYQRSVANHGERSAQRIVGKHKIRSALKQATENVKSRPKSVMGIDQTHNVWTSESYDPLFNKEAISYAFKNAASGASELPENRMAISAGLRSEAKRFWELVRRGEVAVAQWG